MKSWTDIYRANRGPSTALAAPIEGKIPAFRALGPNGEVSRRPGPGFCLRISLWLFGLGQLRLFDLVLVE